MVNLEAVVCAVPVLVTVMLAMVYLTSKMDSSVITSLKSSSQSTNSTSVFSFTSDQQHQPPLDDNNPALPNVYNDAFEVYYCYDRSQKQKRGTPHKFTEAGTAPKFMIIGSHKSGSTAMYSYLALHGHIRPALCKEVKFFDHDLEFAKGKQYYLANFRNLSEHSHFITGDGSPTYIYHPLAPQRVYDMFPERRSEFRFISGFRNPSLRFFSHWIGLRSRNETLLNCDEFWDDQLDEVQRCMQGGRQRTAEQCELVLYERNAVVRGMYAPQLERWLAVFPASQFLVFQSEYLFQHVQKLLQRTAKFLGVRPYTSRELKSFSKANLGTNHLGDEVKYPFAKNCTAQLERTIDAFYKPHNQRLHDIIQTKFAGTDTPNYWLKDGRWRR